MVEVRKTVPLIVDALDEYSGSHQKLLAQLQQIGSHVQVLITSRPHVTIPPGISATLENITASEADMKQYILTQIQESSHLSKLVDADATLETGIVQEVLAKAEGM